MKWVLISLGTLAAIFAGVLLIASTKPPTIAISRSIVIHAPPQVIFGLIDDFHNWPLWASQDREDKTMKRSFLGAAHDMGAVSTWTSKGNAGAGRMTISRSVPYSQIEVRVDFRAPFVAHNVNEFSLEPAGAATRLTWSMHGTNIFLLKLMSVFISPESLLGPHFEKGLAVLKSTAENQPAKSR
jgi:carbon monoxide dehydrogenase subunit G